MATRWAAGNIGMELRLSFLSKAKEYYGDECLTWPYGKNGEGRPLIKLGRDRKTMKTYLVYRLICEHAYGPSPTLGYQVAHSCGKGHLACIARKHLRWATVQENMDDNKIHGTLLKGETKPNSKLSDDQVVKIRESWPRMTQRELAERFKVSRSTVFKVVSRQIWTHI